MDRSAANAEARLIEASAPESSGRVAPALRGPRERFRRVLVFVGRSRNCGALGARQRRRSAQRPWELSRRCMAIPGGPEMRAI